MTGSDPTVTARARLSGPRSQEVFMALLWALAEPGRITALPAAILQPDIPTCAWLALALADVDVTVSVDDDPDHALASLIHDVTGATIAPLERAWLAVLPEPTVDLLTRAALGDALHPEEGARIALPVAALRPGDPSVPAELPAGAAPNSAVGGADGGGPIRPVVELELTGPGVPGLRRLMVDGLDPALAHRLGRSSGAFPAGIDTWLFTPDGRVAAVPRSTGVHVRSLQPARV